MMSLPKHEDSRCFPVSNGVSLSAVRRWDTPSSRLKGPSPTNQQWRTAARMVSVLVPCYLAYPGNAFYMLDLPHEEVASLCAVSVRDCRPRVRRSKATSPAQAPAQERTAHLHKARSYEASRRGTSTSQRLDAHCLAAETGVFCTSLARICALAAKYTVPRLACMVMFCHG